MVAALQAFSITVISLKPYILEGSGYTAKLGGALPAVLTPSSRTVPLVGLPYRRLNTWFTGSVGDKTSFRSAYGEIKLIDCCEAEVNAR